MRPKLTSFKQGDVLIDFWYKSQITGKFLVFCYGLPSHPYQHNPAKVEKFIEEGYTLIYPDYIGTWGSTGEMSWENCVKTVSETVKFLQEGRGKEVYNNKEVNWIFEEASLVGGSFGGSVVLVAGAKIPGIKKIIAIAGPTNWRNHSKIPEESAEPIEDLYNSIKRGWSELWRIPDKKEWTRLVEGTTDLNPIDYVEVLKDKEVMLIHGKGDEVVSVKRSEQLHEKIGGKLLLLEAGHLGNDAVGRSDAINEVLDFLKS